jgi:hypothetical protein
MTSQQEAWRQDVADVLREATQVDRSAQTLLVALRCIPAVAIALVASLILNKPETGVLVAAGAFLSGFGELQEFGRWRHVAMLTACLGMAVSAFVGALVGHWLPAAIVVAAVWGMGYGLLGIWGAEFTWLGMQCCFGVFIAGSRPGGLHNSATFAGLILCGGLLQNAILAIIHKVRPSPETEVREAEARLRLRGSLAARTLRRNLTLKSLFFQHSVRLSVTLAVATALSRHYPIQHSYWVPLTALLILRTDFRQTFVRALLRLAGTFVGVGTASIIAATLRPDQITLIIPILLFAALGYALRRVNYGVYAACVAAYIVFLLAFAGLPELPVAKIRLFNTFIGGVIALLAYAFPILPRRQPPDIAEPDKPTDATQPPDEAASALLP